MVKEQKYSLFKARHDKDTYFDNWEQDKLLGLTEDLKERIYKRYLVKCEVFKRDSFKCQNLNCTTPSSDITLHHIKWQKNGGEDSSDNCVTLCDECHRGYHAAVTELKFAKSKSLPKKIRGLSFILSKSDEIDWKQLKKKLRKFRRSVIPTLQGMDDQDLYTILRFFFDEMMRPE